MKKIFFHKQSTVLTTMAALDNSTECFFYELIITSKSPCAPYTIGALKNSINLVEIMQRPDCFHNEVAYAKKMEYDVWSNNYTSPRSREIFDCHFIRYEDTFHEIEFNIKILFFSLKQPDLLIPIVIKGDNQIISIIRNHIMIHHNLTTPAYHNYRIEMLCKEIAVDAFLDLRYINHPACTTNLYPYQRDSINWAINMESSKIEIEYTEHKLFHLHQLGLIFDYDLSNQEDCFIKYGNLPRVRVYGGIIADEVGLGKTVQALSLALSLPGIKTIIIVPNHIKDHWQREMTKHFNAGVFDDTVMLVTFTEAMALADDVLKQFQRLIVDELAELYAIMRAENHKLFARLCKLGNFQYRWGITATPFVDDSAMYNIIRFLLGNYNIARKVIGNYSYMQDQFKQFFRKNTKANVQKYLQLPEIVMNNIGLMFSAQERAILNAMEMDVGTYSIEDRLRIISNAMYEATNSDKNVITVEELQQSTVLRFQQKVEEAELAVHNVEKRIENLNKRLTFLIEQKQGGASAQPIEDNGIHGMQTVDDIYESSSEFFKIFHCKDYDVLKKEMTERIRHLEVELESSLMILERRKTVHQRYSELTERLAEIIQSVQSAQPQSSPNDDNDDDDFEVMDSDKTCPICMDSYKEQVVLFINCGHCFCPVCFERCHKERPNTCPMCRSAAGIGEINYIGISSSDNITSTKNYEIMRLLKSHELASERFLVFTRFDKFIKPLINYLTSSHVNAMPLDDFKTATQEVKDSTRVIIMSANSNASGSDMTFMRNVIIIEPFDNYVYGKEIEKQLIGRVHRINQSQQVNVFRLFIRDTIEEDIYALG